MAAKQQEGPSMKDTFKEFKDGKNIDRTTLVSVLEDSFRNVLAKQFGSDENFDIIVNPENGDFEIHRNRVVVADDEVTDANKEIALSEAQKIESDYEIGEDVSEEVDFAKFGRRAILTLRQTLAAKILELEHDNLYHKYKDLVGHIVSGEIYQIWKREVLVVDDAGDELILPKSEQIPNDKYRKGDSIRAVVYQVNNENNNPKILISRTSPLFMEKLLEQEVPEIADGLITIHKIARIPGERAKIAVESYDDRIDPVGACVGTHGNRINGIVRELNGEKIDVITYTANTKLFIQRALSPAEILNINVNEEEKRAEVSLNQDQVSLAIGKGGQNIKLAGMLTGYTLDVYRNVSEAEEEEDVYMSEFVPDIPEWIVEQLHKCGLETAKQVLKAPREILLERADLEEETVDEILEILAAEFEDE